MLKISSPASPPASHLSAMTRRVSGAYAATIEEVSDDSEYLETRRAELPIVDRLPSRPYSSTLTARVQCWLRCASPEMPLSSKLQVLSFSPSRPSAQGGYSTSLWTSGLKRV